MSVGEFISVGERARSAAEARCAGGLHRLGQPEVEDLDLAVTGSLDVLGLEIAMDDALVVGLFERLRDLQRGREALGERERTRREAVGQRRTVDELHHQGVRLTGGLEAVDLRDVGVRSTGRAAALRARSGRGAPHPT